MRTLESILDTDLISGNDIAYDLAHSDRGYCQDKYNPILDSKYGEFIHLMSMMHPPHPSVAQTLVKAYPQLNIDGYVVCDGEMIGGKNIQSNITTQSGLLLASENKLAGKIYHTTKLENVTINYIPRRGTKTSILGVMEYDSKVPFPKFKNVVINNAKKCSLSLRGNTDPSFEGLTADVDNVFINWDGADVARVDRIVVSGELIDFLKADKFTCNHLNLYIMNGRTLNRHYEITWKSYKRNGYVSTYLKK